MSNFSTAQAITFLDTETTNTDPAKSAILQIAIVTDWVSGETVTWSTKIKPKKVEMQFADPEALKINRYNEEDWKDAPTFDEIAPTIIEKLMWGPIVAHNAQFDISHIKAIMKRYGYEESWDVDKIKSSNKFYRVGYPVIDTCALAYMFSDSPYQNMDSLRSHFNLSAENSHDALKDTMDCREIFYRIVFGKIEGDPQ